MPKPSRYAKRKKDTFYFINPRWSVRRKIFMAFWMVLVLGIFLIGIAGLIIRYYRLVSKSF